MMVIIIASSDPHWKANRFSVSIINFHVQNRSLDRLQVPFQLLLMILRGDNNPISGRQFQRIQYLCGTIEHSFDIELNGPTIPHPSPPLRVTYIGNRLKKSKMCNCRFVVCLIVLFWDLNRSLSDNNCWSFVEGQFSGICTALGRHRKMGKGISREGERQLKFIRHCSSALSCCSLWEFRGWLTDSLTLLWMDGWIWW